MTNLIGSAKQIVRAERIRTHFVTNMEIILEAFDAEDAYEAIEQSDIDPFMLSADLLDFVEGNKKDEVLEAYHQVLANTDSKFWIGIVDRLKAQPWSTIEREMKKA